MFFHQSFNCRIKKGGVLSKVTASFLFSLLLQLPLFAQKVSDRIQLNQLGFYPAAAKVAVVTGAVPAGEFYVTTTNLKDTLFTGRLGPERQSQFSATLTRMADFSPLQQKGSYVVLVPGLGHSYPFRIDDGVLQPAAVAALKGFYYQRVSMPLEPQYAGKWHRSAGHADTLVYVHPSAVSDKRPAGFVLSAPGGWYDAGDYNKYIVNSGITMGTLLSAYEDFPAYFAALHTHIPESSNAVPDILDEVLYNLRWMLTMQDPNDGGVYHKCTNANFDGMVMPGVTAAPRYVVQKGTAAALDFAAVMAQAARIYKPLAQAFPGLADSCLAAAVKAWQWAQKNPNVVYDQEQINKTFEPDITTGAYGDRTFQDEWLWAAAELFSTTGGKQYLDVLTARMKDTVSLPSWSNVGMLGYYTLLRSKNQPASLQPAVQQAQRRVLQLADEFIARAGSNAFGTIMGQSAKDFIWGSSSVAANQGILLVQAYLISRDKKYIDFALTNMDYLLGRNATGYSFLTGIGSKTPMHPHHRPSIADGITEPVPGLLSGGPNPGMQDKCTYPFTEPETAFVDADCSYASNEIAINWNAPLVYLANALEAVQQQVGYAKKSL